MKICIDAGHNYLGYDTGATGNGLLEQNITFEIANMLKNYMHSVGIQTVMTRPMLETNIGTSLESSLNNRAKIANDAKCDLFISIHCNSNPNKTAHGTETLISARSGEAEKLANCVQKNIVKELGTTDRGVRVDNEYLGYNLAVLEKTNMPAILVETAFISNTSDAELLKNNTTDFALAIFWGICDYLEIDTATKTDNDVPKELETVNDIVWELGHRGIVTDKDGMIDEMNKNPNGRLYWLARKCVNYIRGNEQ